MNLSKMISVFSKKHKNKVNYFRCYSVHCLLIVFLFLILLTPVAVIATENGSNITNTDAEEDINITIDAIDELFSDDESLTSISDTISDSVPDPLYLFNHAMFSLNDKFYFYLLKPVALGYQKITPLCLRKGISNFFYNTLFPLRFVNNILQAKFNRAFSEGKIFVINTMAGGLGFATPAQDYFDMHNYREDLGQTLGTYSIKEGCFLVLPILGPSTLRDFVGKAGDIFLSPMTYIESIELVSGLRALDTVNTTAFRTGDYEALKEAALDPYVALMDAYIQMRKRQVQE